MTGDRFEPLEALVEKWRKGIPWWRSSPYKNAAAAHNLEECADELEAALFTIRAEEEKHAMPAVQGYWPEQSTWAPDPTEEER